MIMAELCQAISGQWFVSLKAFGYYHFRRSSTIK